MQTRCRLTETGSCFVSVFTASVRAQCLGNGVETCGAKDISCEAPWDSSPRERTLREHLFIGLQYATTRLSVVNDWWCHPPLNTQLFSSGGYRRLTQSSVVHHIALQNICWIFHFSFLLPLVSFLNWRLQFVLTDCQLSGPFFFLWPHITRTSLSPKTTPLTLMKMNKEDGHFCLHAVAEVCDVLVNFWSCGILNGLYGFNTTKQKLLKDGAFSCWIGPALSITLY